MRVLFLSTSGSCLGLAGRVAAEGHDVEVFITDPVMHSCGGGIVKRPVSWRPSLPHADLIVADCQDFSCYETAIRKFGKPALGVSLQTELFEYTEKFFELCDKLEIRRWEEEQYGSFTVPSSDSVSLRVEGWWNGRDFVQPFLLIFRDVRLLTGYLGPEVESMGSTVLALPSCRLTQVTLEKLRPFLNKVSYRGPVSIQLLVGEEKAVALRSAASLQFDETEAFMEGLREPILDVLFETATGAKKKFEVSDDTMISVRMITFSGGPLEVRDPKALEHVWLSDVQKMGSMYFCPGGRKVVLKATAIGRRQEDKKDYTREARNRVYRTLSNVDLPDKAYRLDIGEAVNGYMETLKKWGWL